MVKNPRSRPRQGLPLDREQRPLTCHPLGPSLCLLSLKLQSQPGPVLTLVTMVKQDIRRPTPIFSLSIPGEFTGQRPVDGRILNNKPSKLRQFNAVPEGPRADAHATAQASLRTRRRRSHAQGPEGEAPDAKGHPAAHKGHHGASNAPQKWVHPPLEPGYENMDRQMG